MTKLPRAFPRRWVSVPGYPDLLAVPKYIVRIDSRYPNGTIKNRAWQLRYCKPSMYFADGKKSPRTSLRLACAYLASIYTGPKSINGNLKAKPTKRRKVSEVMEPGLRIVRKSRRRSGLLEIYIEAMAPCRGKSPRRVYVGTTNTATKKRITAKLPEARRLRREMVAEHQAKRW